MNIAGRVNLSSSSRGRELQYRHTPVLKYSSTYPVASSREYGAQAGRINSYYNASSGEFISYCERKLLPAAIESYKNSVLNGYVVHEYEALRDFKATYNRDCLLSIYTDRYEFMGGAHGGTLRSSETWDLRQGRRLALKELFPGNNRYAQDIQLEIIRQIEERTGGDDESYFENYPRLIKETFNPASFYLAEEGLAVYFQEYDIAPYAMGLPVFIIPYGMPGLRLPGCLTAKSRMLPLTM